jgi:hypothetical protein
MKIYKINSPMDYNDLGTPASFEIGVNASLVVSLGKYTGVKDQYRDILCATVNESVLTARSSYVNMIRHVALT